MKKKTAQYIRQYKWSNISAMMKNNRKDPKICTEECKEKLVVITGATSGIGYVTAKKYASMGANLLTINRNQEKSEKLCGEIQSEFGVKCSYLLADLSNLADIFKVAEKLNEQKTKIDVIIHNAGIYLTKKEISSDGFEKVFAIHYLASFIINYLLLEKLKAQKKARIIMVGSEGHRFAAWGVRLDDLNWEKRRYSGLKSYGSAKTAQLLSMLIFSEKLKGSAVTINTMHPGAVKTKTGQDNGPLYLWFKKNIFDRTLKSPQISAEALYYLGVSKELAGVSGKFFNLTTQEDPAPPAVDEEVAYELWQKTLEMTGLDQYKEEN